MQTQDARNIQLGVLFSPVAGVHWNEMSGLGKSVDDYLDGVKLAAGERLELNLRLVRGKPTIKYILMSSRFQVGILRGCNNPADLT
jgi:hypothetical protein